MFAVSLLLFVSFSACTCRDSLFCYVTEYDSLETFNTTLDPAVRDCRLYMEEKMKKNEIILPWYFWDNNLSCYTIGVTAKFYGMNETTDLDIRMCAFKDHCGSFLEEISLQMVMSSTVGIIRCRECYENLCNSRITNDNIMKVKKTTNPYRRNLYIGGGGCGVVTAIGALIRSLFCRKPKNNIPTNV